jgi:hypothetical protein
MAKEFLLGCQWRGIRHTQDVPVDTQFQMIRDSGVFDYLDRLPPTDLVDEYIRCSEKYGVPMHTGTWYYRLGKDEPLLEQYLRNGARAGLKMHNIMIFTHHADGHVVTDDEVVDCYSRTWELGEQLSIKPTFELHINMWSEDFRRVVPVAEKVRARGIPFNFTIDYSHCAFKIDNPEEQDRSGIREDVASGRVILDPFDNGSLCQQWLDMGMVVYAQFRPAVPNNPKNLWAKDDKGKPGRGIQYPFLRPEPGQWHSPWEAWRLEVPKEALRRVLRYHLTHPKSPLQYINTEMIDTLDYGQNARYSLFEHNVACAQWIRSTWEQFKKMNEAGIPLEV